MEECADSAKDLGRRVGQELGIPVFLYERAALVPLRARLDIIRRGGLSGLQERMDQEADWKPDFGPNVLHPTAGAVAIGARFFLIAFNVVLKSQDIQVARRIAGTIRSSGGGFPALKAMGVWTDTPGENLLDGGAPFYGPFECKDGKFFTIGAIEPQFYAELLQRAGIDDPEFKDQNARAKWPSQREKMEAIFKTKTRDEWSKLLEGTDACAMAVYSMEEAKAHPHLVARKTFVEHAGAVQPAPAPRFSRTPSQIQSAPMEGRIEPAAAVAAWS